MKAVVRLVWGCLNGKMYFLCLMLVEGKMSNVGGRLIGMMMWADFLRLLLFLGSGRPGKVTDAKVEKDVVIVMDGCGGGCEGGLTQFGGAVREGGCISEVVASGVWLSVGGGCAGNKESSVTSCGGGACRGSGRAS